MVSYAQTRIMSEYMKPKLYSVRTAWPLQPPRLLAESSNVSNMPDNPYCRLHTSCSAFACRQMMYRPGSSAFACCRGRTQCRLLGLHTLRFQTTFLRSPLFCAPLFSPLGSSLLVLRTFHRTPSNNSTGSTVPKTSHTLHGS